MNLFLIHRERETLRDLHSWLTRASMSGVLIVAIVVFPMEIVIMSLCLFALGFSVYILRTLIQLGKKGWVLTYFILIGIPFLVCLIPDESGLAINALWFIPLVLFYFYCWLLRYGVKEWLSDLGDEKAFHLEEKQEGGFDGTWGDKFR
jgi:hypothetical protein